MPTIHELIKDVPLPRMVRVKQTFPDGTIEDIREAVWKELSQEKIRSTIKPGMRICITAGSRGIDRLKELGFSRITGSTVYQWNTASQKLHEGLGFHRISEDEKEITYEREL